MTIVPLKTAHSIDQTGTTQVRNKKVSGRGVQGTGGGGVGFFVIENLF